VNWMKKNEMLNQISKENKELKQRLNSFQDEQESWSILQKLKKQNQELIEEKSNLKKEKFILENKQTNVLKKIVKLIAQLPE